jgi:hypothetical protein
MKAILITVAVIVSGAALAEQDIESEIIDRCRNDMGQYGSMMVKACVDQDMEAATELSKVPDRYKHILARCLRNMRQYGFMVVKDCVDQNIEAEEALPDVDSC